jgi:lysophospholipase L1-like esterase
MSVKGKRVLLIGDSHTVGSYGDVLQATLQRAGASSVTRVAHVGATAKDYLTGKYATEFRAAARQGADVLIITLGTNDAAASDYLPVKKSAENFKSIASAVGAPVTFWVGPPAFHPDSARLYSDAFRTKDLIQRSDELWKAASPLFGDRAIDPREVTKPFTSAKGPTKALPRGDIHLGPKGGAAWASYVFDIVERGSGVSDVGTEVVGTRVAPEPQMGMALGVLGALAVVLILRFILKSRSAEAFAPQTAATAGLRGLSSADAVDRAFKNRRGRSVGKRRKQR